MSKQARSLLIVIAAVSGIAGMGSYVWFNQTTENNDLYRIDFQLTDLDGNLRKASEWDGKLVLMNFWAPWCAPCRAEIPLLVDLQNQYASQGLQILGPALDKADAVRDFANEYQINYPLFADLNAVLTLQEAYGDTRLPYTVLLDRDGRVIYRHAGELEAGEINAQISAALAPLTK